MPPAEAAAVPEPEPRTRPLELLAVGTIALAYAMSLGWNFGTGGQSTYLVLSLRILDSGLLARDWYATDTTQYHPAFALLGAGLFAIDSSGWAFALGHTLLVAATMTGLYFALRLTAGQRLALPAYSILMAFGFATNWRGPLMTYVFDGGLQPSGVSSALLLLSVTPFLRERYLKSSILLALSGLFHLNLLLLSCAAFAFAHLLLGRQGLARRLALQLALPALVFAGFLPTLLRSLASPPGFELARRVFVEARNPHHFAVANEWQHFLSFVGWELVGFGCVFALCRGGGDRPLLRLGALGGGMAIVVWGGVLATFASARFATLFAWRVLPHAELLLELGAVSVVVRLLADPSLSRRFVPFGAALAIPGVLLLLGYYGAVAHRRPVEILCLLAVALALSALFARQGRAVGRAELVAGGGALLALFALGPLARVPLHSSLLAPVDEGGEAGLFRFMRERTPRDALFLTPPELGGARVLGRRAVIVDWKASPVFPGEILEWHRRLLDVTGARDIRGPADLEGYRTLDAARFERLLARYRFDYAVVRKGDEGRLPDYPRTYENREFVVLRAR
ncbi:MAG TPA: DUF6798 domain-containing protein [Polyangiaceae bacterium]